MQTFYIGLTIGILNLLVVLAMMHLGSGSAPMDHKRDDTWESLRERIKQEAEDDPL